MTARRDQLVAGLAAVRSRVLNACAAAARDPAGLTVVVVTKTFPASDVRLLVDLGVHDIGESRHQEAVGKVEDCAGLPLRWHFVGRLQVNKAAAVARYAAVVHSVDRPRLVDGLARGAAAAEREVACLVQVSLDEDPARGGAVGDQVLAIADRVAAAPALRLGGVMAVAPLGADPNRAFDRLSHVAEQVQKLHPSAIWISAGMSNDLEAAVAHGATHLRVGSAILGARPVRV
ncbi:MAG TPA: YggS family pyridoxal phosphate-dependent enzyme [Jiangellaceae bacterium]|nr:YggS family pyridoxal phosphate-dependent enzyme [Jiangellaceae bacterium]